MADKFRGGDRDHDVSDFPLERSDLWPLREEIAWAAVRQERAAPFRRRLASRSRGAAPRQK
jgi:hypothetical protein